MLLTLPSGLDSQSLLPEAAREGVLYTPGTLFYADGGGRYQLRLSFSDVPPDRIEEGVQRLSRSSSAALQTAGVCGLRQRGRRARRWCRRGWAQERLSGEPAAIRQEEER